MLLDNISIQVKDAQHVLFFPTREDIDMLPRIRIGKSLFDLIEDYVINSWNSPRLYQETSTYVHGNPKNVPRQKRKAIVEAMHADFNNFLREAMPYRAQKIVEDGIRERTGKNDLSRITDQEYQAHFGKIVGEENNKYQIAMEQMAAWIRGDPRGSGSSFDRYIQPWSFFNLYLSAIVNQISNLADRLWDAGHHKDLQKPKEFNEAVRLLFLEIYAKAAGFSPLGIVGGASFEAAPEVISWNRRAFYPTPHPEAIKEVYSQADGITEEQIRKSEPAFGDEGIGWYDSNQRQNPQRIITLQTLMDRAFGNKRIEHRPDLWATPSGAVLVIKEVGKRYESKTVFEDYVATEAQAAFARLPKGFLTP